ncbi:MAG: hypothetical protein H0U26_01240, partial [Acidimicrobiia bacterium]|nr:hypothetical protein [Acidimicrobiia bacterium]
AKAAVQQLLGDEPRPALTPLGVAGVLDCLVRLEGAADEEAALDLAQLGLTEPTALDVGVATRAGLLRAHHYHRTRRAVSLADCVAAETARFADVALATANPHLLDLCHDEAITVVVLPDSQGRAWTPA